MKRRLLIALAGLLVLLPAAGLGYVAWLGYFGGALYRLVPAAAAPPPALRGTAAVYWSGDSGFNVGMAPRVMSALAAKGVPVLGVNTLVAFRDGRSPAATRALIADTTRRALRLPGIDRVVLIGQSFGADMLQFGVADLPRDLRPHVTQVLLVVPGDTVMFTATPDGLFNTAPLHPALPSARRIDWVPVWCIHGKTEAHSLCPLLRGPRVRTIALPGDHYLHHDPATLAAVLWRAIVGAR